MNVVGMVNELIPMKNDPSASETGTFGYDHYAEAKAIADQIEVEGFPEQAAKVRSAIDDGRSGTEIVMQLRFYLSPLQNAAQIDVATRARIEILLDKVNEALTR